MSVRESIIQGIKNGVNDLNSSNVGSSAEVIGNALQLTLSSMFDRARLTFDKMTSELLEKQASTLAVKTGFMKRNFLDSFTISEDDTSVFKVYSLWFDSTRFHQLVVYAKPVFDLYSFWNNYPFVATSGIKEVDLEPIGFNISEFARQAGINPSALTVRRNIVLIRK